MDQKISTGLGTAILLVMAFTAGYFVWITEKSSYQEGFIVGVNHKRDIKSESARSNAVENSKDLAEYKETEQSFCEKFSGESNSEIREIPGRKGWNSFTNFRDSYQFEYPTDELEVSGLATKSADKIIWSAQIGYPERLGAFSDVKVYCGNREVAISDYYDDNKRIKIVSTKDVDLDGYRATHILWKDVEYSDSAIGQVFYIQYQDDRTLIISGPFGEKKMERLFDDLIKSLHFLVKSSV